VIYFDADTGVCTYICNIGLEGGYCNNCDTDNDACTDAVKLD
jgi:hypothetical protein